MSPNPPEKPIQVLKVGGAHLRDPAFVDQLLVRVRALVREGPTVLVHGGGREIDALQQALNLVPETVNGLRVTSSKAMDAVAMVLCGVVNKRVVAHFVHRGVTAVGACGADGGLLRAAFYGKGELGRVGDAPRVDVPLLRGLIPPGGVLVLAPVSLGPDGGLLNVNADTVGQAVAAACGAETLEFVTDVDAVTSPEGPLTQLSPPQIRHLIKSEVIRGGMRPKMEAALAALEAGVRTVRVGSLASLGAGEATEVTA